MTEWKTGDVITAERLNEMMVVITECVKYSGGGYHGVITEMSLDEIKTAMNSGKIVIVHIGHIEGINGEGEEAYHLVTSIFDYENNEYVEMGAQGWSIVEIDGVAYPYEDHS